MRSAIESCPYWIQPIWILLFRCRVCRSWLFSRVRSSKIYRVCICTIRWSCRCLLPSSILRELWRYSLVLGRLRILAWRVLYCRIAVHSIVRSSRTVCSPFCVQWSNPTDSLAGIHRSHIFYAWSSTAHWSYASWSYTHQVYSPTWDRQSPSPIWPSPANTAFPSHMYTIWGDRSVYFVYAAVWCLWVVGLFVGIMCVCRYRSDWVVGCCP